MTAEIEKKREEVHQKIDLRSHSVCLNLYFIVKKLTIMINFLGASKPRYKRHAYKRNI